MYAEEERTKHGVKALGGEIVYDEFLDIHFTVPFGWDRHVTSKP